MSRIDFRLVLKKRNRAPPIGDLLPRVDISALRAITRSEIPMVMNEHDETGLCEGPREWLQAVLHSGIAMRPWDGRTRAVGFLRNKKAAAPPQAALCFQFYISSVENPLNSCRFFRLGVL